MTREEAIEIIKAYREKLNNSVSNQLDGDKQAFDMAISALEQEPICPSAGIDCEDCPAYEPCEDAVSREAVMGLVAREHTEWDDLYIDIAQLPSVTQKLKTGHWIEKDGFDGDIYYDCSECGESWATIEGTPWDNEWKYCPNCGADMRGDSK